MTKYTTIGDFLVSEKLIDTAALDRGLEAQVRTGGSLGKALADLGLADEGAVGSAISRLLQIELLTEGPDPPSEVKALLPAAFCRKHLVAPLSLTGKTLRLAMADPADRATIQDVTFKCSKQILKPVEPRRLAARVKALLARSRPRLAVSA
jgi:type IV pilus assembly protein PilB